MPLRAHPTARQARLGAELRKLRERAGLPAKDAAAFLGVDQGKISHIEAGRLGIGEDRLRRLARYYECVDSALIDALCAIVRERRGEHWWEAYRRSLSSAFLDLAELEHHAVALRSLQPFCVPGLLQTEEYARTLFRGVVPPLPEGEVETRVEFRMRRKAVLQRTNPVGLRLIVHEAALRMRFGGRKVVAHQLTELLEHSEEGHIDLRVLPFANENFTEATHPVLYVQAGVPKLDTARLEGPYGNVLFHADEELAGYRMFLEQAAGATLDPRASRDLIHLILRDL
ncbi:helix-turn-helix domain-containing protein [Streptomyces alkaliphilus]|uniref:Helix-turn-helix domain-containing protein n=1 Tax=Streptomyces alkaliphilus TaxID=1472722 RepID=A0A7W3TF68_9ACTN|nr:helix-turn-helix transcriptional regulator [Streptomyces alkaliphilus]MBB0245701.1 helix-turn-helix domain-containing protein [Streptomyces alkaliphilus]